jgi:methanogenic corrinoid protein MtbC1
MTLRSSQPLPVATRTTGPSLYKLVSSLPEERRLRQPADGLVIIGRQLELVMQDEGIAADVAIGTLRFSLFRLHQGRIAQIAPHCRSVVVYGEADVEPPNMPGVEFIALPQGSPLTQEWFLLIDSPTFWGGLLTQAVPERTNGNMRRYLFEGALSADERMVSRASLLLSLASRRAAQDVGQRYPLANRANWAQVAYHLSTHGESPRLNLTSALTELPELFDLATAADQSAAGISAAAISAFDKHSSALGSVLFRCEGQQFVPLAWGSRPRPAAFDRHAGVAGQALDHNEPTILPLMPTDPESTLFPGAGAIIAVPLVVHEQAWGVLLVGQAEAEAADDQLLLSAVGVAAYLERAMAASTPARPVAPPRMPLAYQPAAQPQPSFEPSRNGTAPQGAPGAAPAVLPGMPAPSLNGPASANGSLVPAGNAAPAFGLPSWMRGTAAPAPKVAPAPGQNGASAAPLAFEGINDRSWSALQKRMMGALVAFDQRSAEYVWSEACSMYPTEAICTELLMPVQIAVGEGWHRGEVSVAAEHFCSRFVEGKLLGLLNNYIDNGSGPLAVIGCAQSEMHELGAIMLSLFMRWAGFRVIYLGQNIPNSTIEETIRQLRPQVLGLSATTIEAAHSLTEVGQMVARIEPPRPLFIFGGMAFYERPDLRSRIHGQFLEGDVRKIVRDLAAQLKK